MKALLQSKLKEALKAKDKVKLETIRSVLAAVQYEEMEKKVEPLPADQIVLVLQREIKKRKEEIDFADQAKRDDLKGKLLEELKALEEFLPKQLSQGELENIVRQMRAEDANLNMGGVMKVLKEKFSGQYDGKLASEVVKKVLAA